MYVVIELLDPMVSLCNNVEVDIIMFSEKIMRYIYIYEKYLIAPLPNDVWSSNDLVKLGLLEVCKNCWPNY